MDEILSGIPGVTCDIDDVLKRRRALRKAVGGSEKTPTAQSVIEDIWCFHSVGKCHHHHC